MSSTTPVSRSTSPPQTRVYHKHSLLTRALHWTNFVVMGALLWTALLLLSGTPELPYSHWLPPSFYAAFRLDNRNDEGRVWHVLFSYVMVALGFAYVAYLGTSGRWKTLLPQRSSWRDAYLVVLNDLGIRRHEPSQIKYNGAQRIAYTGVVLFGFGEVVTGLPIYFKDWTGYAALLGGEDAIRAEHFAFMLGIVAFTLVHLVQVTRAGWNNFRSMVTGLEILGARGERAMVEQAVPAIDSVSPPLPERAAADLVSKKVRGSLLTTGIVAAALLAFVGFAHRESAARAGVPTWLDWARDTQDAGKASEKASESERSTNEPGSTTGERRDADAKPVAK